MNTWIAFFRGINVGGRNILPMKELVTVLAKAGISDVKTYIQSGNIVFRSRSSNASQLAAHISKVVSMSHGFRPHVIVLSAKELEKAAASNPFPRGEAEPKTLHLYFLARSPKNPDLAALNKLKSDSETYVIDGKVVYLHAPDGIGRSKLAARAEKLLGVDATGRNWRTVTKVLDMAKQIDGPA